jgi:hypothetical protein
LCEKYIKNKDGFLRVNYITMNISRDQINMEEETAFAGDTEYITVNSTDESQAL